ncbi:MAG: Phosphotransferase enzyme family [Candidatus Eremiobacteraeota bacterium]|nr:Phosphotransferase enzyme family [Candidatus Eremiobacteraeota bacterium]
MHRGRHVVVRAELDNGEAFALKLASAAAAERERKWYRALPALNAGSAASRFVDDDLGEDVLLFAVHPAALDARAYAVAQQRLPARFAADVAGRLAALHAIPRQDLCDVPLARIAPTGVWNWDAGGSRGAELAAACAQERRALVPTAFLHGDVRWENVIVAGDDEAVLIDWEDAGRGAPAWDVGCLFASFASYAIRARVLFASVLRAEALDAVVHEQVAGAWRAYRADSENARDTSFLLAAIRCAGLRLAENALAPSAAALSQPEIVALAGAADEMLHAPGTVVARWDGIR